MCPKDVTNPRQARELLQEESNVQPVVGKPQDLPVHSSN